MDCAACDLACNDGAMAWALRSCYLAHRAMDVPKNMALRALLTVLDEYKSDAGEVVQGQKYLLSFEALAVGCASFLALEGEQFGEAVSETGLALHPIGTGRNIPQLILPAQPQVVLVQLAVPVEVKFYAWIVWLLCLDDKMSNHKILFWMML